jgi:DnaK suppressor protein
MVECGVPWMTPEQSERFRELIRDRLSRLTAVDAAKLDGARPVELDQSRVGRLSRQDALQSQALSAAALERNRLEINRLHAALARIDDQDYGWCGECGEPIPQPRLEIDPAAEYCVACARRMEERGPGRNK